MLNACTATAATGGGDMALQLATPMWTQQLYTLKGGLDHLGLASVVQDRILPSLSPGVNVLTVHPRYWSFYTFVVDEFWRRDLPRTSQRFNAFMKRRESIFAISCLWCERHYYDIPQLIGYEKLSKAVSAEPDSYDPDIYYLKNPRGGYAVYASALAEQGLIALASSSPQLRCDAPTTRGRRVAAAFREAIEHTAYYKDHFEADEVPAEAVDEYGNVACLCRLESGPDRPYLVDAFLHGGDPNAAASRRETLRFVCDVADQTPDEAVYIDDYRRMVYFRANSTDGEVDRGYEPHDGLVPTARRWRLYQLREYYAYALNRLLQRTVSWGLERNGDIVPLPAAAVHAQADAADFSGLAHALGLADPGLDPSRPFADLRTWARDAARVTGGLDDPWDLDTAVNEDRIYQWARAAGHGDDVVAGMMVLLTLVVARVWSKELQLAYADDWHLLREGGVRRLSIDRFLRQLRSMEAQGASIAEVGRWIIDQYVVRQHNRVALTKLRDGDTFRLRLEAGAVRFFDRETPAPMNDPRYTALATCVDELGWADSLFDSPHALTAEGLRLVQEGDLPVLPDAELPL
jgi:hypothetical protein